MSQATATNESSSLMFTVAEVQPVYITSYQAGDKHQVTTSGLCQARNDGAFKHKHSKGRVASLNAVLRTFTLPNVDIVQIISRLLLSCSCELTAVTLPNALA